MGLLELVAPAVTASGRGGRGIVGGGGGWRYVYNNSLYLVLENAWIQFSNSLRALCCQLSNTEEVSTKCFSSLLMSGVGNFLYTVSFSAIRMSL